MERLLIEHVQRIRKVELELGPLTVLVGPNGCGKTTTLRCLEMCFVQTRLVATTDRSIIQFRDARWTGNGSSRVTGGVPVRVRLDASRMGGPSNMAPTTPLVGPFGERLAGALARLKLSDEPAFHRVVADVKRVVPRLRDVRMPPSGESQVQLMIDFDDAPAVPQDALSTGTLYALALLATIHGDRPAAPADLWFLLDDIENGLHPRAQLELVRCLRAAAEQTGVHVVVATHSPYVVEAAGLDATWALGAGKGGGTIARRLRDHPKAHAHADTLTAGEFWSWVGEDWLAELEP